MSARRIDLPVVSDGLRLSGGACVLDDARGAVALLHGIPSVAPPDPEDEGYPGLARRFAERRWTAAWADMRGARDSPGYFSIEGWVRDCGAVVEATRALVASSDPVIVVGSSAGGCVAVEAVARGTRVDAVALLAAPAVWVSFAADPQAAVRRVVDEAGLPLDATVLADPTEWVGEFERVVTEDAVGRVDVPVLVLHGTADDVVPVEHAGRIARAARRAEVTIIEGAPHQLRRNEVAIARVLDWLDELFP